MGAVAVDSSGQVWWVDAGARLHRRGGGIVGEGIRAIAVTPDGLVALGMDGRLGGVEDVAAARAHQDEVPGALDLAVDAIAAVAYLIVDGAVISRSLARGDERTLLTVDATALVLSPDRRRLYVADRGKARVLAIALHGGPGVDVVATLASPPLGAGPTGLGITSAGLVATWPRAVVGINARHGTCAVIHGPAAALPLRMARGVAAGRDRRTLWVADDMSLVAVATDGTGRVDER